MNKEQFKKEIVKKVLDVLHERTNKNVRFSISEKKINGIKNALDCVNSEKELVYIYEMLSDDDKKQRNFMVDLLFKRGKRENWEHEMIEMTKNIFGENALKHDFDINLGADCCDNDWEYFKNLKDVFNFGLEYVFKFAFMHGFYCKLMHDIQREKNEEDIIDEENQENYDLKDIL